VSDVTTEGAGESERPVVGRVAMVIGASRGLGAAIAAQLVADGHRVVGTHRGTHVEVDGVTWVEADVTDEASIDAAFTHAEATLGPIEILVVNAAITRDGLMARMKDDDWLDVLDADLTGPFRCARRAVPKMMRARWGRIIFIGSVVGSLGQAGQVNYASAKAGLKGLAHSMARELASRGVCVNVVAPGPLRTDMTDALTDDQRAALTSFVPMGRMGELAEVAATVGFLAGDGAGYISGATIPVDGGLGLS